MSPFLSLKILPDKIRLAIIVIFTSLFAFINSINLAIIAFVFSAIVLFLGKKIILKKIFLTILLLNSIYILFGNWLFSPEMQESEKFLIFRINDQGLVNGIIGALNRNSMIILSFAWLSTIDSFYDIFISINYLKKFNKTIIIFLKWIQNLKHEIVFLNYSLLLRGFKLNSRNIKKKFLQLEIILKAILFRFFSNIGNMTFNGESHFNIPEKSEVYTGHIKISNLSVAYEKCEDIVLKDINLEINEGDIVFIGGNNKSGKTTLLKAISGYIPKIEGVIVSGYVSISNYEIKSLTLKKINSFLRYVVENPSDSIIGLNVGQELLSQTNEYDEAIYYAHQLSIKDFWYRDINTLSGGEQARVVLASLLCSNVKILILESPLSQLDPNGRISFLNELKNIAEKNKTTIIISDQDITDYRNIVKRLLLLSEGRIISDTRQNIFQSFISNEKNICYSENFMIKKAKTSGDIVVAMKNVVYEANNNRIIDNVSFDVYSNQIIALMGNNGSGKSTTALLLSGVLSPTDGIVKNYNQNIGVVFQDCSKQILENENQKEILLSLINYDTDFDLSSRYCENMIKWVDVKPDGSTLDLTSSEIKMLEIASNLYNKDILIFDEPSNKLDNNNMFKFLNLLIKLLNDNKTIIIITHDIKLASFCTRYVIIDKAKIILDTEYFYQLLAYRELLNEKCIK